jgi:hypothetical protein
MPPFAVAVTCIDGRFHKPLTSWMQERFRVTHVDLVTAPGVGAALATGDADVTRQVLDGLRPSLEAHRAAAVVVAAHEDCAGDRSTRTEQLGALRLAVTRVRAHLGEVRPIVGVHLDLAGTITIAGDLPPRATARPMHRPASMRSAHGSGQPIDSHRCDT